VSVVVDDQVKVNAANGETTRAPWSADELARFTRLVQDAVGFDASRGDSVSVINMPFSAERGEVIADIPFYSQPWFWDIVKQVLGVLFILVLVFGVLRPVLNNITGGGKGKELAGLGSRRGTRRDGRPGRRTFQRPREPRWSAEHSVAEPK
jgi:flagellar M-ring protein FliF